MIEQLQKKLVTLEAELGGEAIGKDWIATLKSISTLSRLAQDNKYGF